MLAIYGDVCDHEVEHRPRNHKVPSSIPGSLCQLGFSLAYTFGVNNGVVPRKQNREISICSKTCLLIIVK